MHRALLRLHASPWPGPSLHYKQYCFASVRGLCSNKITKDGDQEKNTSKEKKESKPKRHGSQSIVKVIGKSSADKSEVQPHQKASKSIDSLVKDAQNISSIGPNDPKSISGSIGKPKTFVRQSARSPIDAAKVFEKNDEPVQNISRGLDKRLVEAARRVASKMPKHIAQATEKELVDSIQKHRTETMEAKKKLETRRMDDEDYTKSITYQLMKEADRFSGSRQRSKDSAQLEEQIGSLIEKLNEKKNSSERRRSINRSDFKVSNYSRDSTRRDTGFFSGECLNIFDPKASNLNLSQNTLWEKLQREEVELTLDFPPENQFEEMVKWTKEGKLWKFPINNEQGIEDDTPFYEHVLLDNLLEEFPTEGPVRQFMDLVLIGLSRNPYMTVERKRETITFYKNFFEERDLLHLETVNEATA